MNDMTGTSELALLVNEIKAASEKISTADEASSRALEELKKALGISDGKIVQVGKDIIAVVDRCQVLENSVNDLLKKQGRPGAGDQNTEEAKERKDAIEFLKVRHEDRVKKKDPENPFKVNEDEVKSAITYRKALNYAINNPMLGVERMPEEYRKSLSAFSFGVNAFMLSPEMSNIVVRCIVDPSDLSGLMSSMTTSSPSVKFLIDNARMALAAWACEASCFANNPQPDLQEGIGELEIKPETLRFIVCVTRDLLEDASINVENWILNKCSDGIRATINNTLIAGDGVGKPIGLLNPNAGIPICDTSPVTPAGQFTWQDLVMLKYEVPMEWQDGCSYLMNQRTWALLMTMSDSQNRPLWGQLPGGAPGFTFAGSPIQIVTQMPDIAPGSTPVAYGNWKRVYMIIWRKAITMQVDPYTAGFCVLYKFEARVGGGILCPNAARLLRIR